MRRASQRAAEDVARLVTPRAVARRPASRPASTSAPSTAAESSTPRRVGSLPATPGIPFALQIIGAISLIASGTYVYRSYQRDSDEKGRKALLAKGQIFTVPVDGAATEDELGSSKTLEMLTSSQTDARLRENENTYAVRRKNNPVYRYDTNSVSSNNPVEDDSCCTILSRDTPSGADGDLLFFGIFDGHAGWQTSRLLANQLVPYVARELHAIFEGHVPDTLPATALQSLSKATATAKSQVAKAWDLLAGSPGSEGDKPPDRDLSGSPAVVGAALRLAFIKLDTDIVQAPVRMLQERDKFEAEGQQSAGAKGLATTTTALQTILPAMSGSCALLAFIDTAKRRLHVACTGDSRAVMGIWEPSKKIGDVGRWRAVLLTDDQTGRSESEAKRMRSEHPSSEKDRVVYRGRVLGGLEPTRAFGDARYKWPAELQDRLRKAYLPHGGRGTPPNYETPPYVTADPVVTSTSLPEELDGGKGKQFIILATDGLWDRISSEQAVALVGAWMDGEKGARSLPQVLEHLSPGSKALGAGYNPSPDTKQSRNIFEDANAATHLIRNALGGADRQQVSALLSIPAPLSRRYRDDITCTVVFMGEGRGDNEVEGVRRISLGAKL